MSWIHRKQNQPIVHRPIEAELYGDLWPMVKYLRAHDWSVFIVPPSERKGNMKYRVGTKLMSAEALAQTYQRVHERNERAKAMASERQQGETENGGDRWIYLPEPVHRGGDSQGDRPVSKRYRRRPPTGARKGGAP